MMDRLELQVVKVFLCQEKIILLLFDGMMMIKFKDFELESMISLDQFEQLLVKETSNMV